MIRAEHICKYFDHLQVLNDISITFNTGECSLIIGVSGSGKTVLLKSLVGLHRIELGEIWYDDTRFDQLRNAEKKRLRRQVGMLFQGSALFDFANVEENVRFPMDFFTDWSDEEKKERVNFCLKRVGLENVSKLKSNELSGGMQKRVGIARAIALNPRYLFCDEPNSGLDPKTSILIDRLIYEITHEYNMTTIVNTHDMNSAMEIGDKIGFIYNGSLIWTGSKDNVLMSDCKELDDFVFATSMAQKMRATL